MKRVAILLAALCLLLPASALAQTSPTCQSYNPQDCTVINNVSATQTLATSPSTSATKTSTLPFTGLDVVLLAAGGATLLGAGLVVRRLSAGPSPK